MAFQAPDKWTEPKSFMTAMKAYFGLLPGEQMSGYAKEMLEITEEARIEYCDMLNAAGYPTLPPAPRTAKPGG